jgi:deoxyribodipyrimidine photo-lyase
MEVIVHWFRRDVRLSDNTALAAAARRSAETGAALHAVFIFDRDILDRLDADDRRVPFLHREVLRLRSELAERGVALDVLHGRPAEALVALRAKLSAAGAELLEVNANDDSEPSAVLRDADVASALGGVPLVLHHDHTVLAPDRVLKGDGSPYTVFTPYARRWRDVLRPEDLAVREPRWDGVTGVTGWTGADVPTLEGMGFQGGEDGVIPPRAVDPAVLRAYAERRDVPAVVGTSRLSVHLRFGTVSVREAARAGFAHSEKWLTELIWRDFYRAILHHFPHTVDAAFKPAYDAIPWRADAEGFAAWCAGKTGYPLVDAGMRELNATGFMHNRVRMVVASFLCKHLLLDWRLGERYFAKQLLDFELASNVGGWQWAAGSGCDAAPYFRVFNPTTQLAKFDPDAHYVRRWIPEWNTGAYPAPIVDHAFARARAIATYKEALGGGGAERAPVQGTLAF